MYFTHFYLYFRFEVCTSTENHFVLHQFYFHFQLSIAAVLRN